MGKIYFHAGDYGAVSQPVEVIGSIVNTGAELSALGAALRPHSGNEDRHVFTNCSHVMNGFRIAIGQMKVLVEDVVLVFHKDGTVCSPKITQNGRVERWPEGFFDQLMIDSAILLNLPAKHAKEGQNALPAQEQSKEVIRLPIQKENVEMDHEALAKDAGFYLSLTLDGRYIWVSEDGKEGTEHHSTQNEAWEECVETNSLSTTND